MTAPTLHYTLYYVQILNYVLYMYMYCIYQYNLQLSKYLVLIRIKRNHGSAL